MLKSHILESEMSVWPLIIESIRTRFASYSKALAAATQRPLVIIGLLAITLPLAYLLACWYLVHAMIAAGRKPAQRSPAKLGFPQAEELSFRTRDGVPLVGWFVPSTGEALIVLVHGIYSNAWDGQAPDVVRGYHNAGFNVFLFDSRGQGRSGGSLGLAWLERQDVLAAVNLCLARGFQAGMIGIHGTSYGAATALVASAVIPEIGAIIADSSFADIRDVMLGELSRRTALSLGWARLFSPGLALIARRRIGVDLHEASPEEAISRISPRPVLLIHGEDDPIISVQAVARLGAAGGPETTRWLLPERRHTEGVRLAPDYETPSPLRTMFLMTIVEFFRQHLGKV